MRNIRVNGLGILMGLKKVCGGVAKYMSWKDTRRWSENGMLEPEALKDRNYFCNFSSTHGEHDME